MNAKDNEKYINTIYQSNMREEFIIIEEGFILIYVF
jgi:hypothetical protein